MRRSHAPIALVVGLCAVGLGSVFVGCDAGVAAGESSAVGAGPDGTGGGGGSDRGAGGAGSGGDDLAATGAVTVTVAGATAASSGSGQNPCGTECGPQELCDGVHAGLDDNCNGQVDEGCPCTPGQATDCFKGDPSYRQAEGCFPGTMRCSEFGQWGSCDGGAHAWGDTPCQEGSLEGCHPINAVPFQVVNLKEGTGIFSEGADAESWTVTCPPDVSPCPTVTGANPADDYQPLQSGEYTVTYTKTVAGQQQSCTYPLYVGARGLRVELTWNFAASTDLDLHMLQPGVPGPMSAEGGNTDCGYNNCVVDNYETPLPTFETPGVEWFPENAPAGEPVAWYLDPVQELNSCYYAPRGKGARWAAEGRGCHNPRLDLDNISCSVGVTDPANTSFCAPENINVDFPPHDQWTRIGVVHYTGASQQPTLKIFCDGALKAVLGPEGYNAPVQFSSSGDFLTKNVWLAADVAFVEDECSSECIVQPIFQDPAAQTPLIMLEPATGPAFPPLPVSGEP